MTSWLFEIAKVGKSPDSRGPPLVKPFMVCCRSHRPVLSVAEMTGAQKIEYPPNLKLMLERALKDTEGFWGDAARELHWFKPWNRVFEWNYPNFKWFLEGRTNLSYNCVDRHVLEKGRGDKAAIIWESGETNETRVLTYRQLLDDVKRLAAALRAQGVEKGDRVTIYMPMVPEATEAMLACTRIGAIHSVVFGGFGAAALAERIVDAGSKVLLTADVAYRRGKDVPLKEVVDEALETPSQVQKVVLLKRAPKEPNMKKGRDLFWDEALDAGKSAKTDFVPVESNELAFILHTSGTTAKPKGTVQPHGSYQVYISLHGQMGLQHERSRHLVVYIRHRMDRWSQLRRLRAVALRLYHAHVRRCPGLSRPGCLVAHCREASSQQDVDLPNRRQGTDEVR